MGIEDHYSRLLGAQVPWEISKVNLDMSAHRVDIQIEYKGVTGTCPECGANCPRHDDRKQRSWRHLDTMQFVACLYCSVPRVHCKAHGTRTVKVPWADKNSRFTMLFESFAVRALQAARSIEEGRKRSGLNWHQVDAIKARAVQRGLSWRQAVTIPCQENKALNEAGDRRLAGAKYIWLVNEENLNEAFADQFSELKQADLKVSRAWAIKACFRDFRDYRYAGWARRHLDKWYAWAIRSRLEPIKEKARMIRNHLPHILTCFKHQISNAAAEGLNSKIQTVKANARGYRSFDGFRNSILFYCSGLDMIPEVTLFYEEP